MTFLAVGKICPVNFTSPTPSARPLPLPPTQPRKKPTSCHMASKPKHPGITGSPGKWQSKNHKSGVISSSAKIKPLPNSPSVSDILVMRSIINIFGAGS
ncbi:Uncharacterised protein [Vibrio cholerae]|nr:Uncharacterised protein [Vibrio cholerae]CSC30841.1 Uncharacterised protein [Vibrio cholerae]